MAISSVTNNSSAIQSLVESANGTKTDTKSKITEAQDRFLKLLTTQLQNQDPLNPMDNAELTSQLAQISTVEGIEKLNTTLEKMMASTTEGEVMQAAGMVGKSVMVAGSQMELTDAGAVSGVQLDAFADKVKATVKDANGLVIRTLDLGQLKPGIHNFAWDGKTDAGVQATNGTYTISTAATASGEKVSATSLELARVESVTRTASGTSIEVGRFGQLSMNDIKQIF
jgi:flagellar basal-body rod modification protein FlgD